MTISKRKACTGRRMTHGAGWLLLLIGASCSLAPNIHAPRRAARQHLATEAIDRSLENLEWPEIRGKAIQIRLGTPGDALDVGYLQIALEREIAERQGVVVEEAEDAELIAHLLVGAIGLNTRGRFFGLRGTDGGFFPFTIPKLALYEDQRYQGYANLELDLFDPRSQVSHFHSGPVEGMAYSRQRTYLFVITWRTSDMDLEGVSDAPN